MIPLDQLKLCSADKAEPGMLLIQNARYDRAPVMTCTVQDKAAVFMLAPVEEMGFRVDVPGDALGQWLYAGQPHFLVDHLSTISPNRSDIPLGALCIIDGAIRIAVKLNYSTFYAGLDGSLMVPENFDNFVAFAKWKVEVPGAGDEMVTVYESDLERVTQPE